MNRSNRDLLCQSQSRRCTFSCLHRSLIKEQDRLGLWRRMEQLTLDRENDWTVLDVFVSSDGSRSTLLCRLHSLLRTMQEDVSFDFFPLSTVYANILSVSRHATLVMICRMDFSNHLFDINIHEELKSVDRSRSRGRTNQIDKNRRCYRADVLSRVREFPAVFVDVNERAQKRSLKLDRSGQSLSKWGFRPFASLSSKSRTLHCLGVISRSAIWNT